VRRQVRVEAENFRHLEGFAVEDRKDKGASHQLNTQARRRRRWNIELAVTEAKPDPPSINMSTRAGATLPLLLALISRTSMYPRNGLPAPWRKD